MKILLVCPNNVDGVAYHRLLLPYSVIQGFDITRVDNIHNMPDLALKKFNVVIFNRLLGIVDPFKEIERLKNFDIPYIFDIDDYWELSKEHLMYNQYVIYDIPYKLKSLIKGAKYVTTTHSYFADIIKKINKNVVIIPNAIDPEQTQFRKVNKEINNDFGWIGGIHHYSDLEIIRPCLSKLQELDVNIYLGGYSYNLQYNVFAEWFSNYGKNERFKAINATDVYNYGFQYEHLDVCLIPLQNNKFNNCKSNLKVLEAAFKGKAVICSNVTPYKEDLNKTNSFLCENSQDFYKAIKRISKDKALIEELQNNLYLDIVPKYNITKINQIRTDLLNSLK